MKREVMFLLAMLSGNASFAADSACVSKYKIISDQFYIYNEKSAVSNAVMDRVATYVNEKDFSTIHPSDAKAWREAIEDFVGVGQPMLQNFLEYKAFGCSPTQQTQLNEQINKITEDLKFSRGRLNALVNIFPASVFK